MKTKPLAFLLALTFLFLFSCAATLNSTTVSSIAIAPVELGSSVHILLPDTMIESKKVQEYLRNELNKLGFSKGEYDGTPRTFRMCGVYQRAGGIGSGGGGGNRTPVRKVSIEGVYMLIL